MSYYLYDAQQGGTIYKNQIKAGKLGKVYKKRVYTGCKISMLILKYKFTICVKIDLKQTAKKVKQIILGCFCAFCISFSSFHPTVLYRRFRCQISLTTDICQCDISAGYLIEFAGIQHIS